MSQAVRRGAWLVVLTAAAGALASGCVDRRFVITSNVPAAAVEVNGKPAGATPADRQFTYYGVYRIVLKHEGYETLVVNQPVKAPWYEYPPFDFVSENLIPWTIRDVRRIPLIMQPVQVVPPEAVLDRAQQLRARGATIGVPAAVAVPQAAVVPVPAAGGPPGPVQPPVPPPMPPGAAPVQQPVPATIMPPADGPR
jgi:hypothetical protein